MVRIVVIGAGVVGLSTAVNVQKMIPEAKVTIIADKFGNDTTSSGAGGFFLPLIYDLGRVPVETVRKWALDGWNHFTSLAMSPLAKETGQSLVPGFVLSDKLEDVEKPPWADIVFSFRLMSADELKRFNFPAKYGCSFTTVISQTKKYMPWLLRQFKEQGGQVEFRTVGKLDELAGSYDIVMNCTALGSERLVSDPTMFPVKGQLVKVKAPWVKTFLDIEKSHEEPTYFIPHDDYILVGGTREEGNYNTDVSKEVQDDILRRAGEILPQIKAGEVVGNWAGLRPHRENIRVEKELMTINGRKLRVVHNYGHGPNGVTLGWGTSLQAAHLAREWADEIPRSSRL